MTLSHPAHFAPATLAITFAAEVRRLLVTIADKFEHLAAYFGLSLVTAAAFFCDLVEVVMHDLDELVIGFDLNVSRLSFPLFD